MRLFLLICLLSYDVFIKKMLIEQLIDEVRISEENTNNNTKKADKKKNK